MSAPGARRDEVPLLHSDIPGTSWLIESLQISLLLCGLPLFTMTSAHSSLSHLLEVEIPPVAPETWHLGRLALMSIFYESFGCSHQTIERKRTTADCSLTPPPVCPTNSSHSQEYKTLSYLPLLLLNLPGRLNATVIYMTSSGTKWHDKAFEVWFAFVWSGT